MKISIEKAREDYTDNRSKLFRITNKFPWFTRENKFCTIPVRFIRPFAELQRNKSNRDTRCAAAESKMYWIEYA